MKIPKYKWDVWVTDYKHNFACVGSYWTRREARKWSRFYNIRTKKLNAKIIRYSLDMPTEIR
jgi:hypothetical protein